jgi:hypothetical protein
MVDPLVASQWGLAALNWLRALPETIRAWRPQRRQRISVSLVPQRTAYHEATQPDGSVVTLIALNYLVTNGSEERALLIPRIECHVRRCGTVQGLGMVEKLPPRHASEAQLMFHFSGALNKPTGCTVSLFDQFGSKHATWIRLHYGRPHDPF